MILQKDFYFVRHGQTDHNTIEGKLKGEHPGDTPLNETGRNQARSILPVISSLPIKTICSSPLKRAQETKEIISSNLQVPDHALEDLGECSALIWKEMTQPGMYSLPPKEGVANQFLSQVQNGINQALSLPGPLLVVSHGGVHWAICCLMGIKEHEWVIGNCVPVHFSIGKNGKWTAKKLA